MTFRLLIKTHNKTGLKYLCKTERENWEEYPGSGTHWRKHLRKNGRNISTQLLFETEDKLEFRKIAKEYSSKFDVVNNPEWANLVPEEGDGGDTVSGYTWITDGLDDRYLKPFEVIPFGWERGRSNCIFNDRNQQKIFASKVDRTSENYINSHLLGIQKMIKTRDHSKCGRKGDANSSKRPEVREKIRASTYKRYETQEWCEECQKFFKSISVHKTRSRAHRVRTN